MFFWVFTKLVFKSNTVIDHWIYWVWPIYNSVGFHRNFLSRNEGEEPQSAGPIFGDPWVLNLNHRNLTISQNIHVCQTPVVQSFASTPKTDRLFIMFPITMAIDPVSANSWRWDQAHIYCDDVRKWRAWMYMDVYTVIICNLYTKGMYRFYRCVTIFYYNNDTI